jgi:Protein of unknown function (DUF2934)
MPKATRANSDKETPKKRTRKAKSAEENGTDAAPVTTAPAIADTTSEVVAKEIAAAPVQQSTGEKQTPNKPSRKAKPAEGNGTDAVTRTATIADTTTEGIVAGVSASPAPQRSRVSEELVRRRAYEIYLRRRGQGGSPEQDWFQALQEISGQHVT